MAISHKECDHESTPKARAKCRSMQQAQDRGVDNHNQLTSVRKPAQVTVVPRKRGDGGVVKGMIKAKPGTKHLPNLKKPNTLIKANYDMADVPRMLAYAVRLAWAEDWDVRVGDRFNESEARIVIQGDKGEISLVWRDSLPNGIWKIWVRNWDSSKQFVIKSAQEAIQVVRHDSDRWDEFGNLVNS